MELREVVRQAWAPHMTVEDLCDIGEYHVQKKLYSHTPAVVVGAVASKEGTEVGRRLSRAKMLWLRP